MLISWLQSLDLVVVKKRTIEESIFIILYKWATLYDSGAQMVCREASYSNLLL